MVDLEKGAGFSYFELILMERAIEKYLSSNSSFEYNYLSIINKIEDILNGGI